jgi:sodium/bile acid cotransporter 7
MRTMDLLRRFWFLAGIAAAVGLAWLIPAPVPGGAWIRDGATVAVFLVFGLSLPAAELGRAAGAWRPALAIHLTCLVAAPLLVLAARPLLDRLLDPALVRGLIVLALLPSTITSCVTLTRIAGGAAPVALVNSVWSSLAGVVLVPVLAAWLAAGGDGADPGGAMLHLVLTCILPFALGQALRWAPMLAPAVRRCESDGGLINQVCLLTILVVVFAESFHGGLRLSGTDLAVAAVAVAVLHGLLLAIAWQAGRGCTPGERLAVLFTGTQKSAALGVPMIAVLFRHDPAVAAIVTPLLVYHPLQLVVGSLMAERFRSRP